MRNYWLAGEATSIVKRLMQYHGSWNVWGSNPIQQTWVRNTFAYYSTVLEATDWESALSFDGDQGELVRMQVPQARSLARQFISLTTKQRLNFQCIAHIEDTDVAQVTRLGNALANQIVDQQQLEKKVEGLAELAFIHGAGYLLSTWRTDRGKPRTVDGEGAILYDGDLDIRLKSVFDVFYDFSIQDFDQLDWVEVRNAYNRWSLIAQHPELTDAIMALPPMGEHHHQYTTGYRSVSEDDMVYVYELYHKPTPAIPQGRMLMYGDERTIFYQGKNRYKGIPVAQCKPENIYSMGFGYPQFSNLLPAQEMLDHSFSAVATNQAAFAVQNVTVPRGAGISVQQINGMNFMQFTPMPGVQGGGKPEALQLAQSSPETFKYLDLLRSHMLELSNINSALRGSPPPGVTAGTAIATLTTNALEFMSSFSKAVQLAVEKTMMDGINAYREFASVNHLVHMVGRNFQSYSKKFVGSDLDPIHQVKLVQTNPLMATIAGRSDLAEKLTQAGMVKNMQEYVSILDGAPTQQLYATETSENDLVHSENEDLMEGKDVIALWTDDHPRHIQMHGSLLNNPRFRMNSDKLGNIFKHIEEHNKLAKQTDPFLTAMVRTGKMPESGPPPEAPQGELPTLPGPPESAGAMPVSQPAKPAEDLLGRELVQ